MATTPSTSMFDLTGGDPLGEAVGWLTGTLLGSVATSLCVLAIAFIGLMMLTGRVPVRQGFQVVIGCFLLLGAPLVATTLTDIWPQPSPTRAIIDAPKAANPRAELPPPNYDPYAGASLRRD